MAVLGCMAMHIRKEDSFNFLVLYLFKKIKL